MEYLNRVLGIHVIYKEDDPKSMPNFIHARYRVRKVSLDGKEAIFIYPRGELESVNKIKKHIERIERSEEIPAVLVLNRLTYRQKEYLLRDHISFIVEGKQIYLPFMALYLQERGDGEKRENTTILPSAQLLLLYYIYHGCGEMLTSAVCRKLQFTATSISRASRQLEEMGLIQTEKRGVQKIIFSDRTPEELFYEAKIYLSNPIKRTIYVPKKEVTGDLLVSGYSALSEYSMINPPTEVCYATGSISMWEKSSSGSLQNSYDQYAIELWRYDPKKLSDGKCVDRLSLVLSLREDRDERVEEAVDEILVNLWREIDGKRD